MHKRLVSVGIYFGACVIGLSAMFSQNGYAVTAPSWKPLPIACMPSRAQKWQAGLSETQQAACHCPDTTNSAFACPPAANYTSLDAFIAATNLPPNIASRCCNLPVCPPDTALAGQVLPANGECGRCIEVQRTRGSGNNRETFTERVCDITTITTCPDGTPLAGLPIPPDGNCNFVGRPDGGGGDGGGDCLSANTTLIKADGTRVSVADLSPGDKIEGVDGQVSVNQINKLQQKNQVFYQINGGLTITGEHPVLTTKGYKMLDPEVDKSGKLSPRLEVGDMLVTRTKPVEVKTIEVVKDASPDAYNIGTENDAPFFADEVTVKPFKSLKFKY